MNTKKRLETIIEGESPDKIPWIPRLKIWYRAHKHQGTLPKEYKGLSLREIERKLGLGTPARDGEIYRVNLNNVKIREESKDNNKLKRSYITPKGKLTEIYKINHKAKKAGLPYTEGRVEHLIKNLEDYKIMMYIIENKEYIPTYEKYIEYEREIGNDGMPLVNCGYDPMFEILHEFIGYNRAYYEMHDHPKEFNELYELYFEKKMELLKIIINSPAKLILHGSHYDSQMTSPPIFDDYITPYLKIFSSQLNTAGKLHAIHADADSFYLLNSFYESGIDMVDCFCTAPMVKCTLNDAIDAWGKEIIIWGGIPSTILCPDCYSNEEFIKYLNEIFELIKSEKARIILGVSDNVMPEADIERIKVITEMVQEV